MKAGQFLLGLLDVILKTFYVSSPISVHPRTRLDRGFQ
jgi:hypothetical protein